MQISQLPASNSFSSSDVIAIEINGVTYKLTGSTLATALRTIGGALPIANGGTEATTAADARTALDVMGVDIPLTSSPVNINPGTTQVFTSSGFANYKFIDLYFEAQSGYFAATRLYVEYVERKYKLGFFAWNDTDNALRKFVLTFTSNGRYMQDAVVKMAYGDNGTFSDVSNALHLVKAIGYAW